jgi:hypothetical protein
MGIEESGKKYIRIAFEQSWFTVGLTIGLGKIALKAVDDKIFEDLNLGAMRRTGAIHTAKLGFQAVRDGRRRDVPELEFFGEATLIHAAVSANHDELTHPRLVDEIIEMVADAGINPELSPFVSDEDATQAKELLRQSNRIVDEVPKQEGQ